MQPSFSFHIINLLFFLSIFLLLFSQQLQVPYRPKTIDQYSGFKVNLSDLKKDWQGLLTVSPDRRNPQDYLRGIKDNMALPYASPEPANEFVSQPLIWENGDFIMAENGTDVIYSEGIDATADEL